MVAKPLKIKAFLLGSAGGYPDLAENRPTFRLTVSAPPGEPGQRLLAAGPITAGLPVDLRRELR